MFHYIRYLLGLTSVNARIWIMSILTERLGRLYNTGSKKEDQYKSWIPSKSRGGPLDQFKKEHLDENHLSQVRATEILSSQQKTAEIYNLVEEMLEIMLHTDEIEKQLANFHESYSKFYEKHEGLLVQALEEFIEEKVNFLVYTGHIDKDILKAKVKEIEQRKRREKRELKESRNQ